MANHPRAANPTKKSSSDTRAVAAKILADVALDGASLREALARGLPQVGEARDRAFVTALVNEGARWWLRFNPALDRMMDRPLPRKLGQVRALLVLGLVQLEVLEVAPHAAVAATVDGVRALGHKRMAGLCNAVLRRWQRERETRLRELDADAVTREAWPRWLLDQIRADWPQEADAIVAACRQAPPPVLRVNRRRSTRNELQTRLAEAGIETATVDGLPDALRLQQHGDITAMPGFAEGAFSVQDGAAQWAVDALAAEAGQRVLDACAAPGGKAAHLLERHDIKLVALDVDKRRIERMHQNFDRLGLTAQLATGDAARPDDWWDGQPFDRILLDAPCSATGIIRRHPDIKLHRRASDIRTLATTQLGLLESLWPLLAPGGRLL